MPNNQKLIIVSGGVCSGLGKGIASASIGAILSSCGLKVFMQKQDPYLNVDPGTMSPFQHGEVFVTEDGAETDLDLGHYERFIDHNLSQLSSVSTGQIYNTVLKRERRGDYLGGTIQIIPHITDTIKESIVKAGQKSKADVMIVELGGTVGDIEGEPFIEAVRQLKADLGEDNVMYVHLVLLPYLKASKELKTKPAQASVRELRRMGVQPDLILARADYRIPKELLGKISLFCDVKKEEVIPAPTIKSIYEVPINFEKYGISKLIAKRLKLDGLKPDLSSWKELNDKVRKTKRTIKIGLVGKYVGLDDAYISVIEALKSAGYFHGVKIETEWIEAEDLEKNGTKILKKLKGIVVPGGFGSRGSEGKIIAAKYARVNKVPYLGLCLGSQIMTIEFARHKLGIKDANSTEFDEKTKNPIVHILPGQDQILNKGGTLRLGAYPCKLRTDSISYKAYGTDEVYERHRHRYEFNNKYRKRLEDKGLIVAGEHEEAKLMEIVEVKGHPFMVGSQFHPEFKSRPNKPHPLFREFIGACLGK